MPRYSHEYFKTLPEIESAHLVPVHLGEQPFELGAPSGQTGLVMV